MFNCLSLVCMSAVVSVHGQLMTQRLHTNEACVAIDRHSDPSQAKCAEHAVKSIISRQVTRPATSLCIAVLPEVVIIQ